jgi:hypothetical protein
MGMITEEYDNTKSQIYADGSPFFTIEMYENVGRSLVITILDLFNRNPFSRVANSQYKTMDAIRKEIVQQVGKLERFQGLEKTVIYKPAKKPLNNTYTPVCEEF